MDNKKRIMESKGIRVHLMEQLGITKEEATNLIRAYARNHDGKVDAEQIIRDVEMVSSQMITISPLMYRDYDARHEIVECGKDRTREGIRSLVGDEELIELAEQYLVNNYYENVHLWADAFYHSAQKTIRDILSQGIEAYREFVSTTENNNIYRAAKTFGMEKEVVEFLANNGTLDDFKQFMTDTAYSRGHEEPDTRKCSDEVSEQIWESIKEATEKNELTRFSREEMLTGLSIIKKCKYLTEEQKEELRGIYMNKAIRGEIDCSYLRKMAKHDWDDNFETLKTYIEMSSEGRYSETEDFIDSKLRVETERKMQERYESVMGEIDKAKENGELTIPLLREILEKFGGDEVDIYLSGHTEGQIPKLCVSTSNSFTRNSMTVEFDGTEIADVIDTLNEQALTTAQSRLQEITANGMGETQIFPIQYRNDCPEGTIGALSDEGNSPLVVRIPTNGTTVPEYDVVVPYEVIDPEFPMSKEKRGVSMDEEAIQQFNHRAETIPVRRHSYRFGRADGFYTKPVIDFEIDGETYHIKTGESGNWSSHTLIWRGQDENYPQNAIRLYKVRNEDVVDSVDIDSLVDFISQNPRRFAEYFEEHQETGFRSKDIRKFCADIMGLKPESVLKQAEKDELLGELVDSVEERDALSRKRDQAEDLLDEYTALLPEQNPDYKDI